MIVLQMFHTKWYNNISWRIANEQDFSMSIRVSEEELQKLKQAARIESYASYSEFIRRTALKEADRVIKDSEKSERSKK